MRKQWHEWRMQGVLRQYADGELLPAQTLNLERHLAACAACRERLRVGKAAEQILRQQAPRGNVPALPDARSMFRAVRAQADAQTRNNQRAIRRRSAGALASVCALLGLWMAHPNTASRPTKTNTAVAVAIALPPHTIHALRAPSRLKSSSPGEKQAAKRVVMSKNEHSMRRFPSKRIRGSRLAVHPVAAPAANVVEAGKIATADAEMKERQFAPSEDLGLLAQNMRGLPPDSHLIVTVTDDAAENTTNTTTGDKTTGDRDAPALPFKSSLPDAETFGRATVSALQVDDAGTQVWRVCSIGQNNAGIMTVHCAAAWQSGRKPVSSLAVTMETVTKETVTKETMPTQTMPLQTIEMDRN